MRYAAGEITKLLSLSVNDIYASMELHASFQRLKLSLEREESKADEIYEHYKRTFEGTYVINKVVDFKQDFDETSCKKEVTLSQLGQTIEDMIGHNGEGITNNTTSVARGTTLSGLHFDLQKFVQDTARTTQELHSKVNAVQFTNEQLSLKLCALDEKTEMILE